VEELTAFPYPLSGFQGATSDKEGEGREKNWEGSGWTLAMFGMMLMNTKCMNECFLLRFSFALGSDKLSLFCKLLLIKSLITAVKRLWNSNYKICFYHRYAVVVLISIFIFVTLLFDIHIAVNQLLL